jgi:hypothetical protein
MTAKIRELNVDDLKTVSGGVDRTAALVVPVKTAMALPTLPASTYSVGSTTISRPSIDIPQFNASAIR